jgi:hypothetical protein
MKREDLKAMGLDDATIDKIMAENGKDIEKAKADLETAKSSAEQLKTQLGEANKTIEGFKAMDVDGVKKTADEYKAKFEQAEKDHAAELEKISRNGAAEKFVDSLQPKDALSKKAILAEFHSKEFKLEGDAFQGAKEWAETFKKENAAHFAATTPPKTGERHGSSGTAAEGKTASDELSDRLFGRTSD